MSKTLSDITMSYLIPITGTIENFYPINSDDQGVIDIDRFCTVNASDNEYFKIDNDGITFKLSDGDVSVSKEGLEYLLDRYITDGFSASKDFSEKDREMLSGYAEHSFAHVLETTKAASVMGEHLNKNDVADMKEDITRLSMVSAMAHDIGMSNGKEFGVTVNDEAKAYRKDHALLSSYLYFDHKDLFSGITKDEKEEYIVALAIAGHSKSNSGLTSFSEEGLSSFEERLKEKFGEFEGKTGVKSDLDFDKLHDYLHDDPDFLKEFKEVSRIVSLADAESHSSNTTDTMTNQNGEELKCVIGGKIASADLSYNAGEESFCYAVISDMGEVDKALEAAGGLDLPLVDPDVNPDEAVAYSVDRNGEVHPLPDATTFVASERAVSMHEIYNSDDKCGIELDISRLSPYDESAREEVANYFKERLGELPRYYLEDNDCLEIYMRCDPELKQDWQSFIMSGKVKDGPDDDPSFEEDAHIINIVDDNGKARSYDSNSVIASFNSKALQDKGIPEIEGDTISKKDYFDRLSSIRDHVKVSWKEYRE